MKTLALLFLGLSCLAFTTKLIRHSTKVVISSDSQLFIKGSTNVNTFTCEFNIKQLNTPIPLYYHEIEDKLVFDKAKLVLENTCFDCGNKGMNKDFMALLKSDEHPEILLSLKEISNIKHNPSTVNTLVELTIAGASKTYHLPVQIATEEQIKVSGTLKLNIEDFGLEAPKKALGLIKVSENIEIHLRLFFTEQKE